MEDRRAAADQPYRQQDGYEARGDGEGEQPEQREAHPRGERVGARMAVCVESDEGLQQRRGHLENQRDDSDLGEREAEFLLQERVDGRDHRLHHVVQQVGDADHEQYRVDRSGLREAPQACVRGFCKRLHCCGLWFFSIRVIASRAFRTSPARMYPSNCPCVGWVASRHSVSLYILLNLFSGGRPSSGTVRTGFRCA